MVIDPKSGKPTRIKYKKLASGKKERISAKEAKESGLVNVVVWDNSVLKTALDKYSKKFGGS